MPNESTAFLASLGSWGFFQSNLSGIERLEPSPLGRGALPDNAQDDPVAVHVEGLEFPLQFFQVSVTSLVNGRRTEHVVVSVYPPIAEDAITTIGQQLMHARGSGALCLVVEDRVGWARSYSLTPDEPRAVAAAIAHTKITGGWDESDPIVVIVDALEFRVSGRFDEHAWRLTVRE